MPIKCYLVNNQLDSLFTYEPTFTDLFSLISITYIHIYIYTYTYN